VVLDLAGVGLAGTPWRRCGRERRHPGWIHGCRPLLSSSVTDERQVACRRQPAEC